MARFHTPQGLRHAALYPPPLPPRWWSSWSQRRLQARCRPSCHRGLGITRDTASEATAKQIHTRIIMQEHIKGGKCGCGHTWHILCRSRALARGSASGALYRSNFGSPISEVFCSSWRTSLTFFHGSSEAKEYRTHTSSQCSRSSPSSSSPLPAARVHAMDCNNAQEQSCMQEHARVLNRTHQSLAIAHPA